MVMMTKFRGDHGQEDLEQGVESCVSSKIFTFKYNHGAIIEKIK